MTYYPPRDRDAWFVIRGFVYQVQLTIERWLQLGPDEKLELERGEDIDIVTEWAAGIDSTERLLEQVKHRDSNLTLNSSEARAALANFIEHTDRNPGESLSFRFLTNTKAGTERKPALPKRWRGVEIWEELRNDRHGDIAKRRRLAALRGLLRRGNRPGDTPQETWEKYQRFLAGAGCREMEKLVRQFEWSINRENTIDLRPTLEKQITLLIRGETDVGATNTYDRLFSYVFETLSRSGTKTLTREDLTEVLRGSAHEHTHALARLTDAMEELKQRLDRATERLDDHDESLDALRIQVSTLVRENGMTGDFNTLGPVSSWAVPPAPTTIALRNEVVELGLSGLATMQWVALIGTSGSGKSEIARQIAEAFDGRVYWLSLRDLDERQACVRLVSALTHLTRVEPEQHDWQEQVLSKIGSGLVVLDDIPRFDVNSQLGRTLLSLVGALTSHGVSLITTSPFDLSRRVQRLSLANLLLVPPFNESETRQLLMASGAPDNPSLSTWARLVVGTTAGHAELVVTAAAHLRRQSWKFSEESLHELLARTSESELRSDILRRLFATTSQDSERELLYRAALISGGFGIEEVRLIARVNEPVGRPDAVLANLEGLWIQPQGDGRFTLCPLARQLSAQLDPNVKRRVHCELGLSYMRRESLGPIEVLSAITHFVGAEAFDRAGVAYLVALTGVDKSKLPAFDAGLFSLWSDVCLPERMSLGIKIYIRTLQIAIQDALGNSTDFLVDDLVSLTDSVDDSEVALLAPIAMQLPVVLQRDFERGSRAITRVVASLDSLRNPLGEPFDQKLIGELRRFLWHQTAVARTPPTVRTCLRSFRAIPADILESSATGDAYEMGVVSLCDGVWLSQFELPVEEQDWDGAFSLLDEIAEAGKQLRLSLLTTAARRTQIIITSEVRKNLVLAMKIAEDAQSGVGGIEAFLVKECIGRQLVYSERYAEAIERLEDALTFNSETLSSYRFYAQLALAEAYSHSDRDRALDATLGALALARRTKPFPALEVVKALGESAIATYHCSGPHAAFQYLDEAARLLFQIRSESREWREVHVLLAHANGYLQSFATTGAPPPGRTTTGEEFSEPATGIFTKYNDKLAALYSKESEVAFRVSLALFANALDLDESLTFWASTVPRDGGAPVMHNLAILFRSVDLIAEEKFERAIALAQEIDAPLMGILHLGLALTAKISGIVVGDRTRAENLGVAVGDYLLSGAEGRPDSNTWSQLGRLLKIGLHSNADKAEVFQLLKEPETDDLTTLCGLLLVSVRSDETPVSVLSAHVIASMRVLQQKQVFMPVHRQLILPAIENFWNDFTARSRFMLRAPDLVVEGLNAAAMLPPSLRAQAIVREMVRGLGVEVPDDVRAWLDQKTG